MSRKKLPDKLFVWTPRLAYAVGLLTTDGCLSSDGRHIILTSADTEQLENYKKCLRLSNAIGKTRNITGTYFRVQHGGVQFYRWLLSIGLSPAKSKTLGKILVPDEFFMDFLRGHLDGDGSITTYTDRYNTFKNPAYVYERLWLRFISASERHIIWLRETVIGITGIKGRIHHTKSTAKYPTVIHTLKYAKKDSLLLLKYIYYKPSLICLKRKKIIAKKFIEKMC